ncbi:MAG: tRNA (adenosine(37)-N6)-threonylcarbamoyltransferase complex dimerization subunit type 1 TsaB [Thermoflexales bacterium]|nr:tRNA (adenosine(37)-N6)-threonylcarbamoyltransferase complex dimerization subunit type 1 TsaB [Thermoflexales bacterium]
MGKLLLGIDTATRMASLALHDGGQVRVELNWETANHHTVELVPRIAGMLAQVDAGVEQVAGVAVALGPGSFTGVRVGVATAKGICLARALPIYGVHTLDVLVHAQPPTLDTLVALIRAGRGRWCAARYRWDGQAWRIEGEPWLATLQTLGDDWEGPALLCGELDAAGRHTLQNRLGERVRLATPAASLRRAGYLAEIGWQRLWHGHADDLTGLVPIYLKTPGSPSER